MKDEAAYARKFTALYRKIKAHAEPQEPGDAVTQMIIAFLMWEAGRKQAENAYKRLMTVMVDNNDLRVSRASELKDLIGASYPRLDERIERMRDALQEVYLREHAVVTYSLEHKSKKEVRQYFDTLAGMTPYVAAQVCLVAFGAHAMPVDEKLMNLLKQQGVIDPDATVTEVESFLERHFKAGEALEAHTRLQAWVDAGGKRVTVSKKAPTKKTKSTAKKTTKKTTKVRKRR